MSEKRIVMKKFKYESYLGVDSGTIGVLDYDTLEEIVTFCDFGGDLMNELFVYRSEKTGKCWHLFYNPK